MTKPSRWSSDRAASYDANWDALVAAGKDPHGEVAFVLGYAPKTVLDAGCGTGRVAIELDRRGIDVVGVDLDGAMLDEARTKAPNLHWHQGDLGELDLRDESGERRRFDVVVMAGNVILFVAPGTEAAVVAHVADHVGAGGVLIAGFQLGRGVDWTAFDRWCQDAGLAIEERFSTWDRDPWEASADYIVAVYSRPKPLG